MTLLLCQPLPAPVLVPPEQAFVVPRLLDDAAALAAARAALGDSKLRPADIVEEAALGPVRFAYVPYWRVGFAMSIEGPLPVFGSKSTTTAKESIGFVLARRDFPYPPSATAWRSVLDAAFRGAGSAFGTFAIKPETMRPRADQHDAGREMVDADVTGEEASASVAQRASSPMSRRGMAIAAKVRAIDLVHFPLYIIDYVYRGEVVDPGGGDYHVLLSGHDGQPLGGKHPSPVRAVASRLRKLFTIGR